jgi:putative inorganic carbon (HCO3(-)) transporter
MNTRNPDASLSPAPAGGGRRPVRVSSADRPLRLQVGALWTAFIRQSPSFWFVSFFLFIEYVRPQAIYESIAVVPWGKISLGGAALFALIEGKLAFRERGLWILMAVFTAIILASSAQAYDTSLAFGELNVWIIWLLAMIVISASCATRTQLVLTFVLWFLWNFKMSQSAFRSWAMDGFRFRDWGVSGAPGWFGNSGEFGIEMCVFLPIVGYFTVGMWPTLSKWQRITMVLVTLSALVGAIGSSSRGALLGMGAIAIWVMLRSPQRLRAIVITFVLAAMSWLILPEESKDRWRDAGDDKTSQSRLQYWKDGLKIASEYPVLGIGYNSWMPYYRDHYDPTPELPHNLFIECLVELGYVGLFVFLLLVGGTFWQNAQTRKRTGKNARAPDRLAYNLAFGLDGALIGYLASGFFVTVFFYPFFWINLAFTMAIARYSAGRR